MSHAGKKMSDNYDGNELPQPSGFLIPGALGHFQLIPVTHDESVFLSKR